MMNGEWFNFKIIQIQNESFTSFIIHIIQNESFTSFIIYIAFPDWIKYSYIKKIEPQNNMHSKRPQNKFGTKRGPQNNMHSNRADAK